MYCIRRWSFNRRVERILKDGIRLEQILYEKAFLKDVQFSSVTQACLTLCDPMACSMPGFPVHHQLPELAQIHVHQVSDAIQPSHPSSLSSYFLSYPASGSFQMNQLFASGGPSIGASASASVLPMNIHN